MIEQFIDHDGGVYYQNVFVVLIEDEYDGWCPRVMTEGEIGKLLAEVHYGTGLVGAFKVYDADERGHLHECELHGDPMVFDEDDYADARTYILRQGRRMGCAYARIDGRA